jgi:LAO/AO transport system kinase
VIQKFVETTKQSGVFDMRRRHQQKDWIYSMIKDYLETSFFSHPEVKEKLPVIENNVISGTQSVTSAVRELIKIYESRS